MIMYIQHITVSSQQCTDGIVDPHNYDPNGLVPLLGRFYAIRHEQWIFPQLQFTCYGTLTRWIFRGVPGRDLAPPCRVELETWRFDNTSTFSTTYQRQSTTAGNTQRILQDGTLFTYVLASPVQVRPGDIVGVEQGTLCSLSEFFDNLLSLNISGTTTTFLSYRSPLPGSTFKLRISSTDREQDFIPLIEPIVGKWTVNVQSIPHTIQLKIITNFATSSHWQKCLSLNLITQIWQPLLHWWK